MLNKCKFCGGIPRFHEYRKADGYYIGKMNYAGMYLKCPNCGYATAVGKTSCSSISDDAKTDYDVAARYWNEANEEEPKK